MDHGILSRVLDDVREYAGDYTIDRFDVGRETDDTSHAVITVTTEDEDSLQRLLMRLQNANEEFWRNTRCPVPAISTARPGASTPCRCPTYAAACWSSAAPPACR